MSSCKKSLRIKRNASIKQGSLPGCTPDNATALRFVDVLVMSISAAVLFLSLFVVSPAHAQKHDSGALSNEIPAWNTAGRPTEAPALVIPSFAGITAELQEKGSVKVIVRLVPPLTHPQG